MMKGGHGQTNQLHDIDWGAQGAYNWGALNHASRAPQLMSCNYYVCVYMCVCVCICAYLHVHVCSCCKWKKLRINKINTMS